MSEILNHLNTCESINQLSVGQLIVITRKRCKSRILCQVKGITNENEVILSNGRNDYFNFDMFKEGKSWVWRVWSLDKDIELTAITNNLKEFPR